MANLSDANDRCNGDLFEPDDNGHDPVTKTAVDPDENLSNPEDAALRMNDAVMTDPDTQRRRRQGHRKAA